MFGNVARKKTCRRIRWSMRLEYLVVGIRLLAGREGILLQVGRVY